MKDNDPELLKAIEEWTGHANARLERNLICMLLAVCLSVIIALIALIYVIAHQG